ncbi:pentapeptide repeat-containing protein [Streptomyces sp. TE33382]
MPAAARAAPVPALRRERRLREREPRGSRLCGSRLRGSRLCGSRLCGSRLCGSRLCGSRLCGSRLCGSRLCGSRFRGRGPCGWGDCCMDSSCGEGFAAGDAIRPPISAAPLHLPERRAPSRRATGGVDRRELAAIGPTAERSAAGRGIFRKPNSPFLQRS